jgi:hypothetical protein
LRVDAKYRVTSAIEDEVLPRRGLLKAARASEATGNIEWNCTYRSDDVGRQRR